MQNALSVSRCPGTPSNTYLGRKGTHVAVLLTLPGLWHVPSSHKANSITQAMPQYGVRPRPSQDRWLPRSDSADATALDKPTYKVSGELGQSLLVTGWGQACRATSTAPWGREACKGPGF